MSGRLNWPQLHKLIWAESLKSCLSMLALVIPSSPPHFMRYLTIYSSFQAKEKFHDRMNRWTGTCSARGGTSSWDLNLLFTANSWLSLTCRTKPRTMKKQSPQNSFSLSLLLLPTENDWVTTFTYLIERNYFCLIISSSLSMQAGQQNRERVLETLTY